MCGGGVWLLLDGESLMFGVFRFGLALAVAISHFLRPDINGVNYATMAVVGFYILSGYLMTYKLQHGFRRNHRGYYLDRFLRIYPAYILTLLVTVLVYTLILGERLKGNLSGWLGNITIVPLNFFAYVDAGILASDIPLRFPYIPWPVILPAWSLGAEIQFYLLAPWVVTSARLKKWLFVLSIGYFTYYASFIGNPLWAGVHEYVLLPGILFTFLAGSFLYDFRFGAAAERKTAKRYLWSSFIFFGFLFVLVKNAGQLLYAQNVEMIIGYMLLLALITPLSGIRQRSQLDAFFGNVAYGVFLSHPLFIKLYPHLFPLSTSQPAKIGFVLLGSLLFSSALYYLLDKRLELRRRMLVNPNT